MFRLGIQFRSRPNWLLRKVVDRSHCYSLIELSAFWRWS